MISIESYSLSNKNFGLLRYKLVCQISLSETNYDLCLYFRNSNDYKKVFSSRLILSLWRHKRPITVCFCVNIFLWKLLIQTHRSEPRQKEIYCTIEQLLEHDSSFKTKYEILCFKTLCISSAQYALHIHSIT